jgi:hypothetical protein
LVFGWRVVDYFPIQLSRVFIEQCLYNQVFSDINQAFLQLLPQSESRTLQSALSDIKSVDEDELLEILGQHDTKVSPSQDNLERVVREIAHKELIQSAMYVIDCWSPILKSLHMTQLRLNSLYIDMFPTTRRVVSVMKFPDTMSPEDHVVANHLKRFVRELEIDPLKKFMRFCTGSDLLLGKEIEIAFVNGTGLARRPVAHTCTCLLELPKSYENFPQFRKEFMSVLNANIWIMDII